MPASGWGRNTWRGLSRLENPVPPENDPPDHLAGFRVLGEGVVLHALLDLEVADFPSLFCGNGLVNVSRHCPVNLPLLPGPRQQVGFRFFGKRLAIPPNALRVLERQLCQSPNLLAGQKHKKRALPGGSALFVD